MFLNKIEPDLSRVLLTNLLNKLKKELIDVGQGKDFCAQDILGDAKPKYANLSRLKQKHKR